MNRVYRLVFNRALGQVQVASEIASTPRAGGGRRGTVARLRPAALALALLSGPLAQAATPLPTGFSVASGVASETTSGNIRTITQASNKALINWTDFGIGSNNTVEFVQPSASAVTLNVVTGGLFSQIDGNLLANGQVFLINPNGIMFGSGANVDVGGLVASAVPLSGNTGDQYVFSGSSSASTQVVNQGALTASNGSVALLGAAVTNTGFISAKGIDLLAGSGATLIYEPGAGMFAATLTGATAAALTAPAVRNTGILSAETIGLRAAVAANIIDTVINNAGVVSAGAISGDGSLVIQATGGGFTQSGDMTAGTAVVSTTGAYTQTGGNLSVRNLQLGTQDSVSLTSAGNSISTVQGSIGGNLALRNSTALAQTASLSVIGNSTINTGANAITLSNAGNVFGGTVTLAGGATYIAGATTLRLGSVYTASLAASAGTIALGAGIINTTGAQTYDGAVVLTSDTALASTGGGNIFFNSTVNGSHALSVATGGTAGFNDDVGGIAALSGLSTDAAVSTRLGGDVTATGDVAFGDAVVLTGNSWVTSTSSGTVTFAGRVDGAHALSVNTAGATRFGGVVGGIQALTTLDTDYGGATHIGRNITTTGGATFMEAVVLDQDVALSSGGAIMFGSTVDGAHALSVDTSAAVLFQGAIGASTPLSGLAVVADSLFASTISVDNLSLDTRAQLVQAGSYLVSGNATFASDGDIVLVNAGNDFGGVVDLAGGSAMVLDSNALTLGTLALTGYLTASSTGALNLGRGGVAGNLTASSNGGAVGQSGALAVGGSSAIDAASGNIALSNAGNDFAGAVSLRGGSATITDRNALTLGTLLLNGLVATSQGALNLGSGGISGNLTASSNGGAVSQSDALAVGGTGTIDAANSTITLDNAGNDFTGTVNANGGAVALADANSLALGAVAADKLSAKAGGNLSLGSPQVDALTVDAGGAITAGAIAVDVFTLAGGQWSQLGSALPSFHAGDFRITGGTFLRALGGDGTASSPWQLTDAYGLQGMGTLLSGHFLLASDIDGSEAAGWNCDGSGASCAGFAPVGRSGPFTGTLDGQGHAIEGLVIDRPGEDDIGLFGYLNGTVQDLRLTGGSVVAHANAGAVAGIAGSGALLHQISSSTPVSGTGRIGGLVGSNNDGTLDAVQASATVTGYGGSNASDIGGLAGFNAGLIVRSSASGDVRTSGDGYAGGLAGVNATGGVIHDSYATGDVDSSGEIVGGLVGDNRGGTIYNAYATGHVTGGRNVGGLVGRNINSGQISDVYASGDVGGNLGNLGVSHGNIGGLVGDNYSGSITRAYSTGRVDGNGFYGVSGMVGFAEGGTVSDGYFDADRAGVATDGNGGVALTTAQTLQQSSFAGFDFANGGIWRIYEGYTTPLLRSFLTAVTLTPAQLADRVYDGTNTGTASYSGSQSLDAALLLGTLGYTTGSRNVGTYTSAGGTLAFGGLYSTQQGYDISYDVTGAALAITPAQLLLAATATGKTYDGTTGSDGVVSIAGLVAGDSISGLTQSYDSRNAGNRILSVDAGYALDDGNGGGNYAVSHQSAAASIDPKAITAAITAADKTYDGTTAAATAGNLAGAIAGDDLALATDGHFADRNAGVGKTVHVTGTLSGTDAGNYVLTGNATTTASIDPKAITAAITAADKTYDGTTAAATAGNFAGAIAGDDLVLATNGHFADRNAGVGKTVHVTGTLSGTDAGNYVLTGNATTTATIDPKAITAAITAVDKTYDGTTAAATTGNFAGAIAGDDLVLATDGHFADRNAGVGKTVHVTGSLSGADAGNYVLTGNATTTATVSPAALLVSASDATKLWELDTLLRDYTVQGLFAGDSVDSVVLASAGQPAHALPGSYDITASAAQGTGLDNYTISYRPGRLTVLGLAGNLATVVASAIHVSLPETSPPAPALADDGAAETQVVEGGISLPASCPPDDYRLQCVRRMPD